MLLFPVRITWPWKTKHSTLAWWDSHDANVTSPDQVETERDSHLLCWPRQHRYKVDSFAVYRINSIEQLKLTHSLLLARRLLSVRQLTSAPIR